MYVFVSVLSELAVNERKLLMYFKNLDIATASILDL